MTVLRSDTLCDCLSSQDWFYRIEQNRIEIVLRVPMHFMTVFSETVLASFWTVLAALNDQDCF